MNNYLLENEITIRLIAFFSVFILIAIWEVISPRRVLTVSKVVRWSNNLGLVFMNSIILRLLFPAAALGAAVLASERSWGLFNQYELPLIISAILSVILLDMVIYFQHVMVHAVPILWRLHRVHHADPDYDVTTGARFHPLEIILSMLIKLVTIIMLGPPVVAVILFEVLLNATAMFNHGNIKLPLTIDNVLRWLVVTPDMHRVHHSVEDDEANSNYGFNLPWWDRLFGTYRDQPRKGHEVMDIGIHHYHDVEQVIWLPGLLTLPFIGRVTEYAINRRNWSDDKGDD